jgi:glycosyltransferase involved in cell wall biosynthesis
VACPDEGYLPNWTKQAGATWIDMPMTRSPGAADLGLIARARSLLRESEVAHPHSSKAGAVVRLAAATMGTQRPRVVFTPHGWSWYVGGRAAPAYRLFERWAAKACDVVTAVSEEELALGRAVLGPKRRMELVENGVDVAAFDPVGVLAPRRDEPLIVQVGRLSEQKGQDRAIKALAALSDSSVRLRFVGDGPDRESLEALARELSVSDRIEYVGSVDPRPHLRAADVVILPSRWEGMSLVLLEAMAIGAAIISSDCGGSDALKGCGLFVDHRQDERAVSELVAHLELLIPNSEKQAEWGRLSHARAIERFSLQRVLQEYERIWAGR